MNFIKWVLAFAVLGSIAVASPPTGPNQFTNAQNAYFTAKNRLRNPGWENGKVSWTASGGTYITTVTSGQVAEGTMSASWDSSAAAQTLTSDPVVIVSGDGLSGQNGVVSAVFKCATGTCTHTLQAFDVTTSTILNSVTITSSTTSFVRATANFIFPSASASGVVARIVSVASDEPVIYVDSAFLGLAEGYNIGSVSQAQLYGTITVTGCSSPWSTSSTSLTDFSAETSCSYAATGNASAPATMIPAIKFSSLPPGEYTLQAEGIFDQSTSAKNAYFQFWDGTNTARELSTVYGASAPISVPGIHQSISYSTPQSNVTLSIRAKTDSGGSSVIDGNTADPLVIKVYKFPAQSEIAIRAGASPSYWIGYHGSDCSWSRTNTVLGDPATDASCTLNELKNVNMGSVTGSNSLPSITFTPNRTRDYRITAKATVGAGTSTSQIAISLTDGSTVYDTASYRAAQVNDSQNVTLVGYVPATAGTPITIKIQTAASSGTVIIDQEISTNNRVVQWTIEALDTLNGAPLLVGSVTSNSAGAERIERLAVAPECTTGTCAQASNSSNWATVTWNTTGNYTLDYTGTFSSAPTCTCNAFRSAARMVCYGASLPGATTWVFATGQVTNVDQNSGFTIICMGPR
jgi:hypothetical protein